MFNHLIRKSGAARILSVFFAFITLTCFICSPACSEEAEDNSVKTSALIPGGPEISSESAIVMDINSGSILYSKNETMAQQPSSLTKIITALVSLENLNPTDSITCSIEATSQNFPTAANVGYPSGSRIMVSDAVKGSLMASAEDSTYSLCEAVAGNMSGFASLMNTYADEHGFVNSEFINGLGKHESGHYSCCYDIALAASSLMTGYSSISVMLGTRAVTLDGDYQVSASHRFISGKDSCSYVYAGKTGGTAYGGNSKWSLCTFASSGGLNLVCIVMGSPSNDASYTDTKALFSYAFENYCGVTVKSLISDSQNGIGTLFDSCNPFESKDDSLFFYNEDACIALPIGYDASKITRHTQLNQIYEFKYGNNVVGSIDFLYDGTLAGKADIYFYTENATMADSEFIKYFPFYLINPESISDSDVYLPEKDTSSVEKATFFNKIKAGILSLNTPAKSFAAIISLLIFAIGTILIILLFPMKTTPKTTLYTKGAGNHPSTLPEDHLSEVRKIRPSGSDKTEMTEIK